MRDCGPWHSHWNCGVRSGTRCHIQPQTQRAVQCRTRLETERGSQTGTRCRARGAIHCRVERGVEFPGLGTVDGRAEPGTHRETDSRAKSLNDGHIDGGSERGLELRSHPRIDPLIAGASAGSGSGSQAAGWDRPHSGV